MCDDADRLLLLGWVSSLGLGSTSDLLLAIVAASRGGETYLLRSVLSLLSEFSGWLNNLLGEAVLR